MRRFALILLAFATTVLAVNLPCTPKGPKAAACSDASFAAATAALRKAFRQSEAQLSAAASGQMESDAAEWLAWTQRVCPAGKAECLTPLYRAEEKTIAEGMVRAGGMQFYPRTEYRTAPDPAHTAGEPEHLPGDPGYGVGEFAWPQVDRANERASRWNRAVRTRVAALKRGSAADGDAFEPSPLGGKHEWLSYRVAAANARLIEVTFTQSIFPYGAAHPATKKTQMNWWLPRGREVRAEDVFRPGSGWRPFLARVSYEQLVEMSRRKENPVRIFPEAESRPAAEKAALQTGHWTLLRDGLWVTFPAYSVAAGFYGEPTIFIRWGQLRPYLAAGLDPETLPVRVR
ncbi:MULTISPECIES: RsiV family protein [Acidobacterium]|uniref:DUF3298 domain-containing protein n=1 Tax=Acidobacterium capsulatum (strain ATCC 51196 / DSM 11244 / BCRC 80197 / JCM 7670 / NBRC 15755 / NCIMB 13165 / 161) TaxID=240015 RepID=C1F1U1_ACIC5|nr:MULTISPECIES: RsiV family protein [Acidobacterium]ACO33586.1 hypothetical protein ACP_2486 [Acidobacterium capsulatum ATCC 51196]HCT61221.1 DUF3298 domain-containing protein [Acidobacterium sp.]